jgi:hypothetical protein
MSKVLPGLLDVAGDIKFTHNLIDNWNSVSNLLKELPDVKVDIN